MTTHLTKKTVYAAALIAAAGSGTFLATATRANAQAVSITAAAAQSAPAVSLSSEVFIERKVVDAAGKETISMKKPGEVVIVPGDRVMFKTSYKNNGSEPATGFRATNPMPAPIQFVSVREEWAEVSVDGGVTWGKLAALTVSAKAMAGDAAAATQAADAAPRPATEADVTHVRWILNDPIPAGAGGDVSFVGLVK
jgi:uncharacterized repeat protein (TIGR01451 family)